MGELKIKATIILILSLMIVTTDAQAQEGGGGDVESLYDQFDSKQSKKRQKKERKRKQKFEEIDGNNLSSIYKLEPFSDIAVIQKRYLPKTERFEFSISGMSGLNNAFFNNLGAGLRLGYHFIEKVGVELQYFAFSSSKRDVTESLESRSVRTSSIVTAKSYVGASIKWSPIYGKVSFLNESIVPFDMHFLLGAGQASTEDQDVPAFHVGGGQSFALSKGMSVRWDILLNFYQPEIVSTLTSEVIKQNQSDLFFSLGWSFYFPEAKYR
ncbi:MAG: outer membrane beta-barrel domain-containing protein [Bdellovibrionaceae bacterium]|jgi:outer membrane beta-barrel protein|nr:outer membrane beta-barrel domain-containing protein [Pseudobdellovibrionaceae bacterium]